MWTFTLSTHELSKVVWRRLFSEFSSEVELARASLVAINDRLDRDRAAMAYQTGSISFASGMVLYFLTRKIMPTRVFEVGTFIGRSTAAMLLAMDRNGTADRMLYTCDLSNDFVMDTSAFKTTIKAMPRKGSTEALQAAVADGKTIDMFHLDGRLQGPDMEMVAKLSHERTVFLLDDFEGIEKGVINAIYLRQNPKFANYFLIEPPLPEVLGPLGMHDRSITALLVPPSVFQLTPQ